MLQRIQSLYLLGAIFTSAVLPFKFYLWKDSGDSPIYFTSQLLIGSMFGLSAVLSLFAFLSYHKRKQQFIISVFNIVINVILLGFLIVYSIILPGENDISEKGIGLVLPLISIVLLILANAAIKRDEKLVKSSNRIR